MTCLRYGFQMFLLEMSEISKATFQELLRTKQNKQIKLKMLTFGGNV